MTVDYADFQTPQAHASAIAITGAPLLALSTNVRNVVGDSIGALATKTYPAVPMTQIGYEISFTLTVAAGSTVPFATVDLLWSDSVSGNITGDQQWTLGGAAAGQVYVGVGPCEGDTLTVSVTSFDTVNAMTVTWNINQNSRVYTRHDWWQQSGAAVPTFTNGVYDRQGGLLLGGFFNVNAAAVASRWLPLYNGMVTITASCQSSLAGHVQVTTLDRTFTGAGLGVLYENQLPATNEYIVARFPLPRAPSLVSLSNNGAANGNFSVNITAEHYPT